jgi:hypothetical protein
MNIVARIGSAAIFAALFVSGCGIFPEKLPVTDPRVRALFAAADRFDRSSYGFSSLPSSGTVHLESRPRAGYDAMLHVDGKTLRTIAFRKNSAGYEWIGEQEVFQGPKQFQTVDGNFPEEITLTYEIEHISGPPLNRLNISYIGEDRRLAGRQNLSLEDVKPILKEWGY